MSYKATLSLLNDKGYRYYQVANFLFVLGIQVQNVSLGWFLYEKTSDPFSLGLLGLAEALPFLCFSLFGGHFADVYPRRKLVRWAVGGYTFCSMMIAWMILNDTFSDAIKPTFIYTIIGLTGICRGMLSPSKSAWVAQLVKKEDYARASSINGLFWQTAAVSGPALGGLLLTTGYTVPMFFTWMAAFIALILFGWVPNKGIPPPSGKENMWARLKEGIRFFRRQPVILSAVSLDMFGVLFGGAMALLPVFAKEVLHTGPEGLGWLRMAPALGAVLSGIMMMRWQPTKNAGRTLLLVVTGFGICMIGFALSSWLWLSLIWLALSGFLDQISVVIRHTILNVFTPDEMRGRVNAIHYIFIGSSNEMGSFESGLAARLLGLIPSVIAGGAVTIGIAAFVGYKAPSLRKLSMDLD